jgi:hypothetical protein
MTGEKGRRAVEFNKEWKKRQGKKCAAGRFRGDRRDERGRHVAGWRKLGFIINERSIVHPT